MVEKVYPMTLEGKAKLEQELEELKQLNGEKSLNESKSPVALVIYLRTQNMKQPKDEQAFVEGRITTIENMIRFAQIIDNDGVDSDGSIYW